MIYNFRSKRDKEYDKQKEELKTILETLDQNSSDDDFEDALLAAGKYLQMIMEDVPKEVLDEIEEEMENNKKEQNEYIDSILSTISSDMFRRIRELAVLCTYSLKKIESLTEDRREEAFYNETATLLKILVEEKDNVKMLLPKNISTFETTIPDDISFDELVEETYIILGYLVKDSSEENVIAIFHTLDKLYWHYHSYIMNIF